MNSYGVVCALFPSIDADRQRKEWVMGQLSRIPMGKWLLDVGAGEMPYKKYCAHLLYTSQDVCEYQGRGTEGLHSGRWDTSGTDIVSDITSIPLQDQSVDVILCTEVFEHIKSQDLALKEFFRLLKPGGKLILTAPMTSQTHFAPYHYATGFSKYWYEAHLPSHGFVIESCESYGDYYSMMGIEAVRLPSLLRQRGTLPGAWVLSVPGSLLVLSYYTFLRRVSRPTNDFWCIGYHTVATKRAS